MSKVAQIKGSNGSGKTTIVKQLLALSEQVEYVSWARPNGRQPKIYGTVMHDLGWMAAGAYRAEKPMGGCDLLDGFDMIKQAIFDLRDDFPDYHLVFEGMMISNSRGTFYEFLTELEKTDKIEPYFVILHASLDTCLEHLRIRGTAKPKPLNVDMIADKCRAVMRHAATYDQRYVRYINVNLMGIDDLLPTFLTEIGFDLTEV